MSYILDALRKSESERRRRAGLQDEYSGARANHVPRRGRLIGWGVVLGAGVMFAALLWVGRGGQPLVATPEPASAVSLQPTAARPDGIPRPLAVPESSQDLSAAVRETPAARSARPSVYRELPLPWELPNGTRQGLADLAVTIHVFAVDPAQRILFINNRKYQQGDITEHGVRIERIVEEGVILSRQGQYFKLPRPR